MVEEYLHSLLASCLSFIFFFKWGAKHWLNITHLCDKTLLTCVENWSLLVLYTHMQTQSTIWICKNITILSYSFKVVCIKILFTIGCPCRYFIWLMVTSYDCQFYLHQHPLHVIKLDRKGLFSLKALKPLFSVRI